MSEPFGGFFRGRRVLVTGHTGFKGSWLTAWLTELGAEVRGYALEPATKPDAFTALGLAERAGNVIGDVRDAAGLDRVVDGWRPEVVLHLAAQPIVRRSWAEPRETFETNVLGTVNVLDAATRSPHVRAVVAVTSDKCYQNQEWVWGYRENDPLGGRDPYSASKAAAEMAVLAFARPHLLDEAAGTLAVASARAGNVVGGGDWAADRLVPDTVRALADGHDLVLRNPASLRPWQHVLEPLSGYLALAAALATRPVGLSLSFNFGPADPSGAASVADVVDRLRRRWPDSDSRVRVEPEPGQRESTLLWLDPSRARAELGWWQLWDLDRTLAETVSWYRAHHDGGRDLYDLTAAQIAAYTSDATRAGVGWAAPATAGKDAR